MIGFIGLGRMGGPMAINLLEAHGELVVYDIQPEATAALESQGAQVAGSAGELVASCSTVITSLPGPEEFTQLANPDDGIVHQFAQDSLWIDTTTNDPALARGIGLLAPSLGFRFVDAPVTGGIEGAKAGTLKAMVGGTVADFEAAESALAPITEEVHYVGSAGSGCSMKLIVNLLGLAHTAVSGEALALGRAVGLSTESMQRVLAGSWGDNAMLADTIRTAEAERWGFARELAIKDISLALDVADDLEAKTDLTRALLNVLRDDAAAGDDLWAVIESYQTAAGTTIGED